MTDGNLIALRLFLDALSIPQGIGTLSDRKTIQKAIYLAQSSGANLGYTYGWYKYGPYSPALASDYYSLDFLARTGSFQGDWSLRPEIQERLQSLSRLFLVPGGLDLSVAEWLELLASVHFLRGALRQPESKVKETLVRQKPHLVDHYEVAVQALREANLLES